MKAVLDASVVVKWLLLDSDIESDVDKALALLNDVKRGEILPIQPIHWLAEAAAMITRLQPQIARSSIELLHAMEFPVTDDLLVFNRAIRLAKDSKQHVFDTLYHAVALEEGAKLITADRKYYRKARRFGSLLRLEDY